MAVDVEGLIARLPTRSPAWSDAPARRGSGASGSSRSLPSPRQIRDRRSSYRRTSWDLPSPRATGQPQEVRPPAQRRSPAARRREPERQRTPDQHPGTASTRLRRFGREIGRAARARASPTTSASTTKVGQSPRRRPSSVLAAPGPLRRACATRSSRLRTWQRLEDEHASPRSAGRTVDTSARQVGRRHEVHHAAKRSGNADRPTATRRPRKLARARRPPLERARAARARSPRRPVGPLTTTTPRGGAAPQGGRRLPTTRHP